MFFDDLKAGRDKPVPLIFGTDWWTDCDDVAALYILLKAHNFGLVDLRAIGVNSVMRHSAPSVKAVCEEQGLRGIPIGLDSGAKRRGAFCLYQKTLASRCGSGLTNEACPEAYKLYRRALAETDEKCVIVDVGFPQIIAQVLRSGPDEISVLDGMTLVKSKVSEVVLMGGRWDKKEGREYNFFAYKVNRVSAAYLCEHCPVPLTFLGYEVGKDVVTGGKTAPGLVGIAYEAHLSPGGRPSWDPMTVLYALSGDAKTAGYKKVYGKASVDPATGKNRFAPLDGGPHAYLVKEKEDAFYKERIDTILRMAEAKR
jgi:inosine-uridine nucleoside N-ribohydrolase